MSSAAPRPARADTDRVVHLLRDVRFEVLPGVDATVVAAAIPTGAPVTVACHSRRGLAATIDLVAELTARGLTAVPHIPARQLERGDHLARLVDRLGKVGVCDIFIVGGDAHPAPGRYATGLELLVALAELGHPFQKIGVPAYPGGHPDLSEQVLFDDLLSKEALATYAVTQLCFSPAQLEAWLRRARAHGLALPIYIGIAGPLEVTRLLRIAMRVGVGDSIRFLRKSQGFAKALLRPSAYDATELLAGCPLLAEPLAGVAGVHLCTFDQIGASAAWWSAAVGSRPDRHGG